MTLHELMGELRNRGVRLWQEDGQLRFAAPKGAMDEGIRAQLREHKNALIALIAAGEAEVDVADDGRDYTGELSFAQQRLLFLHRMDNASAAYNLPVTLRLQGAVSAPRLQAALDALVRRHDALRTCFRLRDGDYIRVCEAEASLNLRQVQVDDDEELAQGIAEESRRVFDLSTAPLMRAVLYTRSEQTHVLQLTMHHAVSDGWSIDLVLRALWAHYAGGGLGDATPPADGDSYVRWQRNWLRSDDYARQKAYWLRQLTGLPAVIELPLDHPRPPVQGYEGAVERFDLPEPLLRRLEGLASQNGCSLYMVLVAAFFALLQRLTGQDDLAVGTPVANRGRREWEESIGFFSNVVVLRLQADPATPFRALLKAARETCLSAFEHQEFPFEQVVEHLQLKRSLSYSPLFQTMFILREDAAGAVPEGLSVEDMDPGLGISKFDLTLTVQKQAGAASGGIEYATGLFLPSTIRRIARHYVRLLTSIVDDPDLEIGRLDLFDADERRRLCVEWNATDVQLPAEQTVDALILARAESCPDLVALSYGQHSLTYGELAARARKVAVGLQGMGIGEEHRVGLHLDRSMELVVAMLGTLMAGAAYVPLDPNYPQDRIAWIAGDAGLSAILCDAGGVDRVPQCGTQVIAIDGLPDAACELSSPDGGDRLAYVIYTSGSTGRPKGVMIAHRNVINLFEGLDRALAPCLPSDEVHGRPVWMALTSVSFDISVLELLWTLARGHHVVVQKDHLSTLSAATRSAATATPAVLPVMAPATPPDMSLFYFASDEDSQSDKYALLMAGARFADENGFSALWVPERHFHAFGGQFPNPSIAAAAVAAVTRRIQVRAGSCVLPLHDPIRVAEEWSMIDNLSGGRAGVAFASGWHFNDFILAPERFQTRHDVLRQGVDTVRALWRGDAIRRRDGLGNEVDVRVRPRPVQAELPIWITAAASPDTFRYAGEIGANVLTHLLGQTLPELKEKIALYRRARAEHGHDPAAGKVTLMLHTFVGEDAEAVREAVREPFKAYLRSSINLLKPVAESQGLDAGNDLELVVEAGFNRYSTTSALFGTPEQCRDMIWRVAALGVDEIGCLIDFGVDPAQVVSSFPAMSRLQALVSSPAAHADAGAGSENAGIDTRLEIGGHVTHVQCTPSFARMLLDQSADGDLLRGIQGFLVGGEALSPRLAADLKAAIGGDLFNMYGPTETTVWSAVRHVREDEAVIGAPIANTRLYVLDACGELCAVGVKGELYIGGEGVARGYWKRPDLTAERFVPDPFSDTAGARMYRTGDLVRRLDDGTIEFLARVDNQVKVRGYRVELGEIEAALRAHPSVAEAVAVVRGAERHEAAVHAYVVAQEGASIDVAELKHDVAAQLPDYMRPSAWQVLAAFPLTPNGKIDRNALPAISAGADARPMDVAGNDTEAALVAIWCELLALEAVGIHDNFFELGGHSLLLGKLQKAILDRFGREVGIIELFKYPTIASLASMLGEERSAPRTRRAAERSRARQDQINQMRERMKNRKPQHEPR